jgi:hypothetical protein
MAVQAVLSYGGMLEKEGPPLLGMTLITRLIDSRGLQQVIIDGPVGIMAIGTTDVPLE